METINQTFPALYVGTYAKYSNGSISGKWMYLDHYADAEQFLDACKELHADEPDAELMFQDFQGFPKYFYNESMTIGQMEDLYDFIHYCDDNNKDAAHEYVDNFGGWDKYDFENVYLGEWETEEDFAEHLLNETGDMNEVPERLRYYIDIKAYASDLFIDSYTFCNGHVFINH
jgi:antirestriction protein